jgi:poly-gamma-glutamate synthesis protein (capsule biosynthesis protein)
MEDDYQPITFAHFFASFLVVVFVWGSLWVGNFGIGMMRNSGNLGFNFSNQKASISTISTSVTVTNQENLVAATPTVTAAPVIPDQKLTILMGGDLMLDRGVRLIGEKYGYSSLFATATPLFKQADIVVANLEGSITSNKSKTVLANGKTNDSFTFTFDPKSAKAIADAGISILSLANNHSGNFGKPGLVETKKWLKQYGLEWFGDPNNATTSELIVSKNGMSIAFVGYHAFAKGFDDVVGQVKRLADEGNFVIVMPHWGEEYATSSSALIRSQARTLVSAGAKAIVGSHPHVVLEHSWMGDVPVMYSLGNLLFDQQFSPRVTKGNILELKLVKSNNIVKVDKIRIYETSIASRRGIDIDMEPVDF